MRIKHLLYFFSTVIFFASCSNSSHKFVIIGNISGMPEDNVVLEQWCANDEITIMDSVKSNKDGHFEFSELTTEPGLYRLHFKSHKFILLCLDKENVKVIADWNNIEKYNTTGSVPTENLKRLITTYRDQMRDFHSMNVVLDTLKAKGNDSLLNIARKDIDEMNQKFTRYIENYADTCPYLPNAVFAARILNPVTEITYLDQFTQSLAHRFPNTKMTKDFTEYYLKVSAKPAMPITKPQTNIGDMAPEVALSSLTGEQITLSSLKGKYVLLDFWAAFCPPCRAENPNIVAVYNKYKNKNFTIYGVSLDDNKDDWEKAIQVDKITWTQVSDLKRWESPVVKLYGVSAIPANFLIDPTGKIIAKDLQGAKLEDMLNQLLK